MHKLTAIIPTGNEAHNIVEAIRSVSFADEVMVVDSYSTDGTPELAHQHADVVYQRKFDYHAAQKNWAIPKASHEWVLLLDADERITPELEKEVKAILVSDVDEVAFWIYRANDFLGRRLNYSGIQGDKCIRLFRKSKCVYEDKYVHEEIIAEGKVGRLQNRMYHNTFVSLEKFYDKMDRYASKQAEEYAKRQSRVSFIHLWFKPMFRFIKHYLIGLGILDGKAGYVYAKTQMYAVRMRYVKLKELIEERK